MTTLHLLPGHGLKSITCDNPLQAAREAFPSTCFLDVEEGEECDWLLIDGQYAGWFSRSRERGEVPALPRRMTMLETILKGIAA